MNVKRNSFLEKEIQDLLVSAGRDRPNLNSSQSTLSPCVRTRQQKEEKRRSLETLLPAPAIPTLPRPLASVGRSNSEQRLKVITQVIIRETSAVVLLSKVVPSEFGRKEELISSPSLTDPSATKPGSRFLRSGRAFQEIKHVPRPRTPSLSRTRPDDVPESRGSNRKCLYSRLISSKNSDPIPREGAVQSNIVKSPISKLLSRQSKIVTYASVPKNWIYSPLSDQKLVRHLRAILEAIQRQSSKKQANLAIVKALFKSSRVLSTRRIASRTWS